MFLMLGGKMILAEATRQSHWRGIGSASRLRKTTNVLYGYIPIDPVD